MRGARGRIALAATALAVALGVVVVLAFAGLLGKDREREGARGLPPRAAEAHDPRAAPGDINAIYERAKESVVFIQARVLQEQQSPFGTPESAQGVSTGTGFAIDGEGGIVTNAHVVENATDVAIRVDETTLVPAEVVGADAGNDLALLRVDPADAEIPPLPLGDSDAVKVGDPVLALGNPLGLEDTVTAGIVSAKQRRITAPNQLTIEDVIQTDAAVNPGNSGGPLLDMAGRVIGVNSQIATAGQGETGFIGIAFAVPVDKVKEIVPDLADDGQVERAQLGVTTVTLTPELAAQLGVQAERGALVVGVAPGSAAERAGLRGGGDTAGALTGGGDVIVRVGDRDIASSEDLLNAISDLRPGDGVPVAFLRDGQERTVRVELTAPRG